MYVFVCMYETNILLLNINALLSLNLTLADCNGGWPHQRKYYNYLPIMTLIWVCINSQHNFEIQLYIVPELTSWTDLADIYC